MENTGELKLTLDNLMVESDAVFIVPHNRPDYDALGACVGMSLIAGKHKRKNYIVINDNLNELPVEIKKLIDEIGVKHNIIRIADLDSYLTDNSLMVCVDVNKNYLISTSDYLDSFKNVVVIDHHKTDDDTIKTPNIFVDTSVSSTCEEIARLLFMYRIKITPDQANYLLAGIVLDTNRLTKNLTSKTFSVLSELTSRGANPEAVNNLFLEEFEHERVMQKLVDSTKFFTYSIGIAADTNDSGIIYSIEDIAKCSDYILRYKVDASFAIAYIDQDTISISARSKGNIDISQIMKMFGGGGSTTSGAARVKGTTIKCIVDELTHILNPTATLSNENSVGKVLKLTK